MTSREPRRGAAERPEQLAVATPVSDRSATESEGISSSRSLLKTLAVMAVSPLLGLAFVVFLPVIGFGMLFAALGSGLVGKLRSPQT